MSDEKEQEGLKVYLSWKNLRFEVPGKKKGTKKTILHGLNGHVLPGQLVAVIGPSGSGKSSFLNCMAGRITQGVTGDILFNGVERPTSFARFTGYVIQNDLYMESLTVRETLTFCARLKLPESVSREERTRRVEEIITDLDLDQCADTKIGAGGAGISGGERRRLAIGLEIINHPSLLMLDEPTSGLDSASALMVGRILRRLSRERGITVLCSVHQPRYKLAQMFDRIYFLGRGHELYYGPSVPDCLTFFSDAGYTCPAYENPADFLLDLVNTSETAEEDEDEKVGNDSEAELAKVKSVSIGMASSPRESRGEVIEKLATSYQESEFYKEACKDPSEWLPEEHHGEVMFKSLNQDFYITSVWNQIIVITHRSFLHKIREPISAATQAFNSTFIPLLFGSVYWQIDVTQQGALDRIGAISLLTLMLSFMAFDILMLFPLERDIFNRENSSGMYRPSTFYVGRTLAEFPQHVIFTFIMGTISYFMYGLQEDRFWTFSLIIQGMVHSSAGLLMLVSAMAKNLEQSNALATVFIFLFMLFDGNWISIDKIPVYWRWISHISQFAYGTQAAIVNEYRGLDFSCRPREITNGECFFDTGRDVLYSRGIEDFDLDFAIVMLFVLAILWRFLAFLFFLFMFRNDPPKVILYKVLGINN